MKTIHHIENVTYPNVTANLSEANCATIFDTSMVAVMRNPNADAGDEMGYRHWV
jgi:hypothetical protein